MIQVLAAPFDPAAETARFAAGRPQAGALASFVGLCRASTGDRAVTRLHLDHYPGFTEAEIARIEEEARATFDLIDTLVLHRCGTVAPGEPIVLVAALSTHRKAALQAVDFLMDYLKTGAPFWKREEGPDGARWIEPRADDHEARAAWKEKA
jgi:molybdopterin synthase catalytic subunit